VIPGEPAPPAAVETVAAAAEQARDRLPAWLHKAVDALAAIVLDPEAGDPAGRAARAELAVRFGQTCDPVMAKGVEDTAFYRWSRLISANEVGGHPGTLGTEPAAFHAFATRLARDWPATMTTLSTHDSKRGEDLRARLAVLAERPEEWAAEVTRWHDEAADRKDGAPRDGDWPEPDTEYLMWQTLAGTWPADPERVAGYLRKAVREAKTRTSWAEPDAGYEDAVLGLAATALADAGLAGQIAAFAARIEPDARVNSLGAKLVQLTMPGVPDLYQGCELGWFALTDPDNRHDVDFPRRAALLAALDSAALDSAALDSAALDSAACGESAPAGGAGSGVTLLDWQKLLITSRALRLRRDYPGWFAGSYVPLAADGPAAGHAVAFIRGSQAVTVATRLPATLRRRGGWGSTALTLTGPAWRDVLTGAVHPGGRVPLAGLTARLPVALLVPA
jgi:(1->4)-alpha-D-glucan 1-alpha-D-glucosylmutase